MPCLVLEQEEVFTQEKISPPAELSWGTNTTVVPVTSCENALLCKIIQRKPKVPLERNSRKEKIF